MGLSGTDPALFRIIGGREVSADRTLAPACPHAEMEVHQEKDPGQTFQVAAASADQPLGQRAGTKDLQTTPCHRNSPSTDVLLDPSRETPIWLRCGVFLGELLCFP